MEAGSTKICPYRAACQLLHQSPLPAGGVRLVGVAAIALTDREPVAGLFVDPQADKQASLERARLAIDHKFGPGHLTRALVLEGRRQVSVW